MGISCGSDWFEDLSPPPLLIRTNSARVVVAGRGPSNREVHRIETSHARGGLAAVQTEAAPATNAKSARRSGSAPPSGPVPPVGQNSRSPAQGGQTQQQAQNPPPDEQDETTRQIKYSDFTKERPAAKPSSQPRPTGGNDSASWNSAPTYHRVKPAAPVRRKTTAAKPTNTAPAKNTQSSKSKPGPKASAKTAAVAPARIAASSPSANG